MNFETRQRCGTCPPSNRTKRGSRANCQCQRWEHLPALITKVAHTLGIPTPGDFHPDRSGGHVVPRWISPEVMVRVSFLLPCWCLDIVKIYKTALIMVFMFQFGGAWSIVWERLAHEITPVVRGQVVCETWMSIVVPRSIWLPNNCRKAFAHIGKFTICAWYS